MKSTHPKVRLKAMTAGYKEILDGPTFMSKIDSAAICSACRHFAAWLVRGEALTQEI
ncbi:DUF4276 family protein [Pseudoduganella aquatica]|uniref:DUF4276 family protein n=1 Tax=Pseudoduganella aquatica TaxID=2660641 RepID=UPI001E4DAA65|nr:DUF4276 family protein [Pseudoduganella aquatica]